MLFLAAWLGFPGLFGACRAESPDFDLLIRNGMIVDGTGRDEYPADVAIRNGSIVRMGRIDEGTAERVLDVRGMVLAPGFIDIHSHAERGLLRNPGAENLVRQGVTTVVGGNCGHAPYPTGSFLEQFGDDSLTVNLALLVGHNTIRRRVLGLADKDPTGAQQKEMEAMVDRAMREGAFGISTGLKYVPGMYAGTGELIALARVVASHGGFYATHLRDEGLAVIDAVREALAIGREANIPVQLSHHKVLGKSMWGRSAETLALVEEAVEAGMDVTLDQHPYTATSTTLAILFPEWSLDGGLAKLRERLQDPAARARIKDGLIHNITYDRGGGDPANIFLRSHPDASLRGQTLAGIMRARGIEPTIPHAAETVMDLMAAGPAGAIFHCLSEEDVQRILAHPLVMHAGDHGVVRFGAGTPHPRTYGTFPRFLGRYVREKDLLSLPESIRKMTSMPAGRLGLSDRGLLKEGMRADLVIFDPDTIMDRATFEHPHQYPEGIAYVLVNGRLVLDDGLLTKARPGRVLFGPGHAAPPRGNS